MFPQMYTFARFFPSCFSCPFCRLSIFVFLSFYFMLSTPSWKWRLTPFVLELRRLFSWSSGHSVKENSQIFEEVCTMTEQVVKSKDFRKQTKKWMAVFFKNCVTNVIEKDVSICVIIQQNWKVKKITLSQYGSKFRAQRYRDKLSKTLESLEDKKAVHTSCRHGVWRICKLYIKERPNCKFRWCEPPTDHLDYR